MIDFTNVRACLKEAEALMSHLQGLELDETHAITSQSRGVERKKRAQRSQDLQLLATRLELAASLVRVEYWYARTGHDPVRPDRRD